MLPVMERRQLLGTKMGMQLMATALLAPTFRGGSSTTKDKYPAVTLARVILTTITNSTAVTFSEATDVVSIYGTSRSQ